MPYPAVLENPSKNC